jgi:hypothetical protein
MEISPTEAVECKVSVSPALARRIRKAQMVEQTGQDAHGSLMIAAGYEPDEVENIRSQLEDMSRDIVAGEQEQVMTKAATEQLTNDLSTARKKLTELDTANKRIDALEETLSQSVETGGLPDEFVANIKYLVEATRGGDNPKSALLAAAGYDLDVVDTAMSSIEVLKVKNAELELVANPLRNVLNSKGVKSWMVRRILNLS